MVNRFRDDVPHALQSVRMRLAANLRERVSEIEEAALDRILALPEAPWPDTRGSEHGAGLRAAMSEIIEFALVGIERGEDLLESVPSTAVEQARRAARHGVSLDMVLRRYAAGDRLLSEYIMNETERFPSKLLRRALHAQSARIDQVMATVTEEYRDEAEKLGRSSMQHMAERVGQMLEGIGPTSPVGFEYEFDQWHLGVIISGEGCHRAAETLRAKLGLQVLSVPQEGDVIWLWLGGHGLIDPNELENLLPEIPASVSLAVGEARLGFDGWRLTHREAQAAFDVMMQKPKRLVRSSDVLLLAAVFRDEDLSQALRETFLTPLNDTGNSGPVLRETLRAYLAAGLNAGMAAVALGVDRHTVQRRLRKTEERLGQLIHSCHAELEVALDLDDCVMADRRAIDRSSAA